MRQTEITNFKKVAIIICSCITIALIVLILTINTSYNGETKYFEENSITTTEIHTIESINSYNDMFSYMVSNCQYPKSPTWELKIETGEYIGMYRDCIGFGERREKDYENSGKYSILTRVEDLELHKTYNMKISRCKYSGKMIAILDDYMLIDGDI